MRSFWSCSRHPDWPQQVKDRRQLIEHRLQRRSLSQCCRCNGQLRTSWSAGMVRLTYSRSMRGGRPGGLQCCRDHTHCATFLVYSCFCLLIWKLDFLVHGAGRRNGILEKRTFQCLDGAIGVTDARHSCCCSRRTGKAMG